MRPTTPRTLRAAPTLACLAALVICLALAAPAAAQTPPTCNGLPATIVGTAPGAIAGTPGDDVIVGTDGSDTITGLAGADTICAGGGADTLVWNPGDGSDTVEGQAGADLLQFNGSNAAEAIDVSANGPRLRFFRDVGNITIDGDDVEQVAFAALGGADTITVNDLSGTDVSQVSASLAGSDGASDGQADSVVVNGTPSADTITVTGSASSVSVEGLSAKVTLRGADSALDSLQVNGLAGADTISTAESEVKVFLSAVLGGGGAAGVSSQPAPPASSPAAALPAAAIRLTLSGGPDADTLIGSDGDDQVIGNQGNDLALLGGGDDTFVWNPGDGSDTVEGQAGADLLQFNGANVAENIDLSANGGRLRFFRNVGNVTIDSDDVEQVAFAALGGADTITVNNLAGTDVLQVSVNLAGSGGGGDGQVDSVVVNGTGAADNVTVAGVAGQVTVGGLHAGVSVLGQEPTDALLVNALAGTDSIDASGLGAGLMRLTLSGGPDIDTLIGSAGNDLVIGNQGNDLALLGGGDDTFVWNPGDGSDTVEGQASTDLLQFNGANVAENIDLSANGGRLRFFRNVGNITIDSDDVEQVAFAALGGADTITANNLAGTDVLQVSVNLAGSGGGGDGQVDSMVVNGTGAADTVVVTGSSGQADVVGLAATVSVTGSESGLDTLSINALAGDDVVEASGLASGVVARLNEDGGDGDDVLIGSAGQDAIFGGNDDDVLLGGPGTDVLDGGPGDNVVIQD